MPPPALVLERDVATAGLRALLIAPRGVDEGVIDATVAGSDTERREGSRGVKFDSCKSEEPVDSVDEGGLKGESGDSCG